MGERAEAEIHQPSHPFGCNMEWGPPLGGSLPTDMLRHVCDLGELHQGAHHCSCGDAVEVEDV